MKLLVLLITSTWILFFASTTTAAEWVRSALGETATAEHSSESLPGGFVDIQTVIPGIQVELRYFSEDNFVGQRIDGYESTRCYITSEAALALKKVQQDLNPFGLALKIYDAYRPQRAHRMLLQHLMSKHGFKPLAEEWWHFTLVSVTFPDSYFDFVIE